MSRHGPTEARTRFAKRLKAIRVPKGFRTARSFAEALGIDENRYTRYERGEVEPSLELLLRMCDLLSATPNDLLCDYIGHAAYDRHVGFAEDGYHGAPTPPAASNTGAGNGSGDAAARASATAWLLATELATLRTAPGEDAAQLSPFEKLRRTSEIFNRLKADPFAALSSIANELEGGAADMGTQQRILGYVEAFAAELRSEA